MYFIPWKTIPQALSTVGKTSLKSLGLCTVNIHHNCSSHLLAMKHWFFPFALFCFLGLFISLLPSSSSPSPHLPILTETWRLLERALQDDAFLKGSMFLSKISSQRASRANFRGKWPCHPFSSVSESNITLRAAWSHLRQSGRFLERSGVKVELCVAFNRSPPCSNSQKHQFWNNLFNWSAFRERF